MRHAFLPSAAACFALILATAAPAQADTAPRTITVTGEGTASATPDEAILSAGVVTSAKTAALALAANSNAMNAVMATLKNAGIPDKDIQTSGFSVQRETYSASSTAPPHVVSYTVTNNVTVLVENLTHLGATLDALVASGANNVGDIQFAIKDTKKLLDTARAGAVADATSRAQVLAQAAGVSLGPITSISESSGYSGGRPMMLGMMAKTIETPIATGTQDLTANVTITWEIH